MASGCIFVLRKVECRFSFRGFVSKVRRTKSLHGVLECHHGFFGRRVSILHRFYYHRTKIYSVVCAASSCDKCAIKNIMFSNFHYLNYNYPVIFVMSILFGVVVQKPFPSMKKRNKNYVRRLGYIQNQLIFWGSKLSASVGEP